MFPKLQKVIGLMSWNSDSCLKLHYRTLSVDMTIMSAYFSLIKVPVAAWM